MMSENTKTGGYTFSYTRRRAENSITIIPLHGLGGSKGYWQPIYGYPGLARCGVLVPDLVGYGDSNPAPAGFGYTMLEQAEAVKTLVDILPVEGDIVLIPHSMGGPIGVYLARLLAPRVKGIVYAEGNIDINDCFGSNAIITKYTYGEYAESAFRSSLEAARKRGASPESVGSLEKAGPATMYRSAEDLVRVSRGGTLAGELKSLGVPVLAVYGETNKGLWTSEKKAAALFPLTYIPGAGHAMMVDNPDAFYGKVEKFISELGL
jgi:pimeloyl-ACP methyl ester carboxylesterase